MRKERPVHTFRLAPIYCNSVPKSNKHTCPTRLQVRDKAAHVFRGDYEKFIVERNERVLRAQKEYEGQQVCMYVCMYICMCMYVFAYIYICYVCMNALCMCV